MALRSHPVVSQIQTVWTDAALGEGLQGAPLHQVPVVVPQPKKKKNHSKIAFLWVTACDHLSYAIITAQQNPGWES